VIDLDCGAAGPAAHAMAVVVGDDLPLPASISSTTSL
jgi:hypothetical protein